METIIELFGYIVLIEYVVGVQRYRVTIDDPTGRIVADISWPSTPLVGAREARRQILLANGNHIYEVELWDCEPGTDDGCLTGAWFETEAEARACYESPDRFFASHLLRDAAWFVLVEVEKNPTGPGTVVDPIAERRNLDYDGLAVEMRRQAADYEWRREMAHQAGMGLGIQAYNDIMGYDFEPYEEV